MAITFEDRQSSYPGRFKVTREDGSAYYVTLERADEPSKTGTPLNAATFNTMISFLTGYADARNLLDNSNFANPVNQRGGSSYSNASQYTIDRWRVTSKISVTVEDGYISLECSSDATERNGFVQYFGEDKTPKAGTAITVAYEDDEGNLYVNSGTMPQTGRISIGRINVYGADTGARVAVMLSADETFGLKWMAVYEGEYAKTDIPTYRAKDYSTELMECMRYYQIRSTGDINSVDLRPAMRAEPKVTQVTKGYAYSADL